MGCLVYDERRHRNVTDTAAQRDPRRPGSWPPSTVTSMGHDRSDGPRTAPDDARTAPDDITRAVLDSFAACPDPRLRQLLGSLVEHLHGFVRENALTEEEWRDAIAVLTATGHITDDRRQEWILWSDALGVSMLVDAIGHPAPPPATESTVLGPFYVPGARRREYGDHLAEQPAGDSAWIHGHVRSLDGRALGGAELDVWQNGEDELYAVQDPEAPEHHLRGRFETRDDGSFGFVAVRPTPYPIPADGPVGQMLSASGRHPNRPAHLHVIVRAPGHRTLATHLFDDASPHLASDAVFAVKPSLVRSFTRRDAEDPGRPAGVAGTWWSLENDFVLVPAGAGAEPDAPVREPVDSGRTA
jgi:protocatechuate 3,4-dioxygenase beta subunit